jgi:hypothetical protein
MLIPDMVTEPVALAKLIVELTLRAPDISRELILIVGPESPLVEIVTCFETVDDENRLKELKVSLLKTSSCFCNSLNSLAYEDLSEVVAVPLP